MQDSRLLWEYIQYTITYYCKIHVKNNAREQITVEYIAEKVHIPVK
jgi:hypothetical protein